MAGLTNAQVQSLLPASMSAIQKNIADALLQNKCIARMGQGPALGTNAEASAACRICMENLAGELNLQHAVDGHTANAGENDAASAACQRTTHLSCLVSWAETAIRQKRPVMCPNDRQLLMPVEISEHLNSRFPVVSIPNHSIRNFEGVVRFWHWVDGSVEDPPFCTYTIQRERPEYCLRVAAAGKDVGFVHSSIVNTLPLTEHARLLFRVLDRQSTRLPFSGEDRRDFVKKFPFYCYMEHDRVLVDHQTGRQRTDFMLMPVTRLERGIIGRYLQGIMGQIYEISRISASHTFRVQTKFLKDADVVNLSAETEIRRRMLQRRADLDPAPAGPWFWPLQNQYGGIVVGGRLGGPAVTDHPARGYYLDDLNIGQANDARLALIAANNPMAQQIRDRLVEDYERGNLPPGFPQGWGFGNHSIVHCSTNGQPLGHPNQVPSATIPHQPVSPPPAPAVLSAAPPLFSAPQPPAPPPSSLQPPAAPQSSGPSRSNQFNASNPFTQQPPAQPAPQAPFNAFMPVVRPNPFDPSSVPAQGTQVPPLTPEARALRDQTIRDHQAGLNAELQRRGFVQQQLVEAVQSGAVNFGSAPQRRPTPFDQTAVALPMVPPTGLDDEEDDISDDEDDGMAWSDDEMTF